MFHDISFKQINKVRNNMKRYLFILLLALPTLGFTVQITEEIELHGFAALAYVNSNNNPFYGETTNGSFDFREAALNGFWEPNSTIRISAQVLYRNTGSISNDKLNLDFLMLDFKFLEQDVHTLGARVGRVKVPYGIYNSSRDIPHGRPAIFVPHSIYFESFRDTILSVDGGAFYGNSFTRWGTLDYQLFAGFSDIEDNSMEHYLFSKNITGTFKDAKLKGLQLMFEPGYFDNLKVGYSLLEVKTDLSGGNKTTTMEMATAYATEYLLANAANPLAPTLAELGMAQVYAQEQVTTDLTENFVDYVGDAELNSMMHVFSLQYFWENFTFTGEYLRIHNKFSIHVADLGKTTNRVSSEAFYGQVEWQVLEKLVLLARYEEFYNNTDDRDGSKTYESGYSLSPITNFSKGYTLGARWYFNKDVSLTAEYSKNRGVSWLPKDDDIDVRDLNEDWDFFAFQLSYHF